MPGLFRPFFSLDPAPPAFLEYSSRVVNQVKKKKNPVRQVLSTALGWWCVQKACGLGLLTGQETGALE